MKPIDEATALSLLLRWYETYTEGRLQLGNPTALGAGPATRHAREVSGLAAATKAFLSNVDDATGPKWCVRCVAPHAPGAHIVANTFDRWNRED